MLFKCPMPKKTLEQVVFVTENNSESSMKYRAEAAAMSEDIDKLQAEQNARARAGGGRVVRPRLA